MNQIKEDLEDLDSAIAKARSDIAEDEGAIKTLLARLLKEENLASEKDASVELEKLSKRITRADKQIRSDYTELREKYTW